MRIGFAGLDVTLFITKFLLSQEFFFPPQLRDGGDSPEAPLHFLSFFLSSSFASIPSPSRRAPTHCSFFLSFFLQCFFNGSFRFGAFRSSPFHLCTAHNGPSNIQVLMQGGTAGHNPGPLFFFLMPSRWGNCRDGSFSLPLSGSLWPLYISIVLRYSGKRTTKRERREINNRCLQHKKIMITLNPGRNVCIHTRCG